MGSHMLPPGRDMAKLFMADLAHVGSLSGVGPFVLLEVTGN